MLTKVKIIVKNRQLGISKIQNSTFVRAKEKKIQGKFEKNSKVIGERNSVLKFLLI